MRGTFIFPKNDKDLMQLLEIRGNNGAVETVETVYILTGSTYYVPERLFACDNPDMYNSATSSIVRPRHNQIDLTVKRFYRDRSPPNMLCWVHTHPNGKATPSDRDLEFGTQRDLSYDRWCGDYEFFHIIHGVGDPVMFGNYRYDHDAEIVEPDELRQPEQTDSNKVSWIGGTRKHTLGVYDKEFDPRPVEVLSTAELQQGASAVTGPGPQPDTYPEPGGEIWDA